jgi:abhydrolase domain-containing protein 6
MQRPVMLSRAYESFGSGILQLANLAQRRAVRARLKRHVDRRGRVTPYLECGAARAGTVVWLHGFSDEPGTFLRTAQRLVGRYRVVAPAMPGFGEGWNDPSERHTFEAYATWLGEFVDDLGAERFHLMGNSLGGATAIGIAASHREGRLASLVVVNSGGLDVVGVRSVNDEMREGHNLFAVRDHSGYERFLKRIFARPPFIPGPVRASLASKLRASASWYERIVADMIESRQLQIAEGVASIVDLQRIRVPTLVVWGDRDSLFPVAHADHFVRAIPGAKLEILEGVGHCPHLESPARLADVFVRFAASLDDRAAEARTPSVASASALPGV